MNEMQMYYLIHTYYDEVHDFFQFQATSLEEAIEALEEASPEFNAEQYVLAAYQSDSPITVVRSKENFK